jgi:hypothetical protein
LIVNRDDEPARWKYKTKRPTRDETKKEPSNPEADLNELAGDGWRFVDTIDYTGGGTKYLVFERPVPSDAEGEDPPEPAGESEDVSS